VQQLTSSRTQPRLFIAFDGATALPDTNSDLQSPQNGMDGLFGHDKSLAVAVEQHFDLVICELLVQLDHFDPPRLDLGWEDSTMTSSPFNFKQFTFQP
jgi:hypothetical protein